MKRSLTVALSLLPLYAGANTELAKVDEEVIVAGVRDRMVRSGSLKNVIQKTEVIDESVFLSQQALNLSTALKKSAGINVSNECSMCGVKRVMLNGMRGEHSTILVDGIPLYTMLAGFYAVDALPTVGVSRLEVARGAGASLIAPEAIGGSINIISKQASENEVVVDAMLQENNGHSLGVYGGLVSDDGATSASLVLQLTNEDQFDGDNNFVSEAPAQDNHSAIARVSHDFSDSDNVIARLGFVRSEIFGGATFDNDIDAVERGFDGIESTQLFVNDDVRERYVGKAWETAEWIKTDREEAYVSWLHEQTANYNFALTVAHSRHEQESFYEGFDYDAVDKLNYVDIKNNLTLNDAHHLTFGIDVRDEAMRSESVAGSESDNYVEDSFDYNVVGVYLQDSWVVSENLDISLAVRIDQVEADFVAQEKPGTEIDETVVAPRIDAKFAHNEAWTSRFSAGVGYRAPLSFFESDHGILDAGDGFAIDIDQLEESISANYAISYESEVLAVTASIAHVDVDNLAAIDETDAGIPLLTQLDESASVTTSDIQLGYQVTDNVEIAVTLENYDYSDAFKSSFGVAPIEQRAILNIDYDIGKFDWFGSIVWVGERDLNDYGYEGFNIAGGNSPKSTKAKAYATFDTRLAYDYNENLNLYLGANNLFDYTQVEEQESPLFWDADDGYDVAYINGPLRGRVVYAGLRLSF